VTGRGAAVDSDAGRVAQLKGKFDHYQRRKSWLGFPLAVFRKFSQDKAGYLAALVSYFGFFSVFPLMLAFMSVLGFVVPDPDNQREFSDAAADELPVVGSTISQTAGEIDGSVLVIVLGLVVALWAGLRIVDAMQNAMNEVWNLPRVERPKLLERRLRGLLMLALIGAMLLATVAVSNVAVYVDVIPGGGKVTIMGLSIAVSVLLYLLSFQLLTDIRLPWKDLLPGAIFGGVCWWALQTFGSVFIARQQESASATMASSRRSLR
jgi:membrane protein